MLCEFIIIYWFKVVYVECARFFVRRASGLFIHVLLIVLLASCSSPSSVNDVPPQNVILILADDMGVGDLSYVNESGAKTPFIDELIESGVWFSQAYSASPVCAPARASLFTGQFPHRTGCVSLNMKRFPELTRIDKRLHTLGDLFQSNGYYTGLIGKWHNGDGEDYLPTQRGFKEFEGFFGYHIQDYYEYSLLTGDSLHSFKGKYLTEDISERAIDFVQRHQDKPFFLHIAHYAPHRPLSAPAQLIDKYQEEGHDESTATIYAMVEIMDRGIGRLIGELERLGLKENTLLIFASDNGPDPLTGQRNNLGLRGSKYMVNEGGIRVPFIVSWPGRLESRQVNEVIHFTDVYPTLMDICQLEQPESQDLDGISFAKTLYGEESNTTIDRLWQWNRGIPDYSYNAAIRRGKWKLVRPFVSHWTIPKKKSALKPVLYNLESDPFERQDVSDAHPELYNNLNAVLDQWSDEVETDRKTIKTQE